MYGGRFTSYTPVRSTLTGTGQSIMIVALLRHYLVEGIQLNHACKVDGRYERDRVAKGAQHYLLSVPKFWVTSTETLEWVYRVFGLGAPVDPVRAWVAIAPCIRSSLYTFLDFILKVFGVLQRHAREIQQSQESIDKP